MAVLKSFLLAASAAVCLLGQQQGIPPEWETRKLLEGLVNNAKKLQPLVGELQPASWKEKGAPDAYVTQWENVKKGIGYLQWSAERLSKEPARVSYALDTLFRLQYLDTVLGSFTDGIRRYQNPAIADLILSVANENAANSATLKQYILDLAALKESELQVIDSEAQRCRSEVTAAPPARPAAPKPGAVKE